MFFIPVREGQGLRIRVDDLCFQHDLSPAERKSVTIKTSFNYELISSKDRLTEAINYNKNNGIREIISSVDNNQWRCSSLDTSGLP